MNYRIVEKEAFEVLGISITTTNKDGRNLKEIPEFWQKLCDNGISEKLWSLSANNSEMYGICFEMNEDGNFKYAAAVPYQDGEKGNFKIMEIPASKWAIFECIGPMPDAIQKVWKRIFVEWLPATEYEIAPLPQLEAYYDGDSSKDDYKSEVWIPIK